MIWTKLIPWGMGALAALLLVGLGFRGGQKWSQAEVLEEQARYTALQTSIETGNATGEAKVAARLLEAERLDRERHEWIAAELRAGNARVQAMLVGQFETFRESINAPVFDCLRLPMPEPALWVLRRPGDTASEDRGDPGPGEIAPGLF